VAHTAGKIESQNFWDVADEKIIAALASFAESAAGSAGIRRQLFAGDVAQGVAFIELMRKRFDVVLMNPPFGEATTRTSRLLQHAWPNGKNDLYAAFFLAGLRFVKPVGGYVGAITSRAFVAGRDQRLFREELIAKDSLSLSVFVDLGGGVLDAWVEVAMFVAGRNPDRRALFSDRRQSESKTSVRSNDREWVSRKLSFFEALPGQQILYGLDAAHRFRLDGGTIEPTIGRVTKGLSTADDPRFVRCRWEVNPATIGQCWHLFSKGGKYGWFGSDLHLVVNRDREAKELVAFAAAGDGNVARTRQSQSYYGRPAVTWSRRSAKGFSARRLRAGACFSDKSPVIVPKTEEQHWLAVLPLLLASRQYQELINAQAKAGSFETGAVKILPVPGLPEPFDEHTAAEVYESIDEVDQHDETSLSFIGPPPEGWSPIDRMGDLLGRARRFLRGIGQELDPSVEALELKLAAALQKTLISDHARISFAVGAAFGRFSEQLPASDEARTPYSPYQSQSPRELNAGSSLLPIAVDDHGHPDDLVRRLCVAAKGIHEGEIHQCVSDWRSSGRLRSWLRRNYFEYVRGLYSQSRRKAPIYWQLATPSASYSVWCYYHSLTRDTFFRVTNDYVTPKVDHEERKLNALRQEAGPDPSSKQRKAIDAQETFVAELRAFKTEVTRIAPLWNPDLNDGVIVNFAPLWRLVPQHKSWQKECKKVWDKLVKGDYDWAHLAMHLWPERVVLKCQDDRSLAIAHGLEGDFWYEDDDGKWQKRQVSSERVEALVAERASTAVRAALKDLLEAPAPAGQTRRKRRAIA
jgi:hypothetical protein